MRLICPNCAAQYEVDDSVIPENGRDVQCSGCGHSWFQPGAAALAAHAAAPAADTPPEAEDTARRTLDASPEAAVLDKAIGLQDRADAPTLDQPAQHDLAPEAPLPTAAEDEPVTPPPPAPERVRRNLDENVMAVLREEAEREASARRAEAAVLETQTDLGLAAAQPVATPPHQPVAAQTEAAAPEPPSQPTPAQSGWADLSAPEPEPEAATGRRGLLPDVEQINSTLRASSERSDEPAARDAPEALARRRAGFRLGFGITLLLAAAAMWLYISAQQIGTAVPTAAPALAAYVGAVDQGRGWLDDQLRGLTALIEAKTQD
ncbi:thioredoxin [Candidatus Falkowbacteria bacterium]|nr:thioredoxin [Candidatus Falkowbacteria bacterium]